MPRFDETLIAFNLESRVQVHKSNSGPKEVKSCSPRHELQVVVGDKVVVGPASTALDWLELVLRIIEILIESGVLDDSQVSETMGRLNEFAMFAQSLYTEESK
jgi:hypothetical protein